MPADSSSSPVPIVALTGFMAAGKSTISRVLASRLNWRAIDLDSEIERRCGMSVQQLFAKYGEERFRRLEAEVLQTVLADAATPTVIALGGGTFVQPANAALLRERGVRVIFLHLEVEQLLERCRQAADGTDQNPRPLARDEASFRDLYSQRLPLYRQAELIVEAHNKSAEEIAHEIAVALGLNTTGQLA